MAGETMAGETVAAETILVRTALASWKQVMGQVDKTLGSFRDEQLQLEVAPGKNRIYYLLGHLTAVSDRLFPLLRVGERMHAELDEEFIVSPDKASAKERVTAAELRKAWREVSDRLTAALEKLSAAEWLERHEAVTAEEFAKEPLRNRLAVVMSRTNHAAMHEGQMRLAIPK